MRISILTHITLLTIILGHNTNSQVLSPKNPVIMHTDRVYYISGDAIIFDIFLYHGFIDKTNQVPDVYIDLLTQNNKWISGVIAKQTDGSASGVLAIPDSLKSGSYLLRAYLRYPYKDNKAFIQKIYIENRFNQSQSELYSPPSFNELPKEKQSIIDLEKDSFTNRELVRLAFKQQTNPITGVITVTNKQQWLAKQDLGYTYATIDSSVCVPENINQYTGIVFCGRVIDARNQLPVQNAVVLISTEDSVVRLDYQFTNSNGEFQFHLYDCYNIQKRFFNVFSYPDLVPLPTAMVIIDSPFDKPMESKLTGNNPIIPAIDSTEIDKSTINKAYGLQPLVFDKNPDRPLKNFEFHLLGDNVKNVKIDDFITLNSFTEISKEILPLVKIKSTKKGNSIHVIGELGNMHFVTDNPLVLIDGVPLTKIDYVLDWGSTKIKNVTVQNKQRYYGDLFLKNGIICIWTRKMDFWDQNSISGTFRYNLSTFQHTLSFSGPDYANSKTSSLPDFRQLIFWKSAIHTNESANPNITFYTSDEKGEFVIEFFGIDSKGNAVYDTTTYFVK